MSLETFLKNSVASAANLTNQLLLGKGLWMSGVLGRLEAGNAVR